MSKLGKLLPEAQCCGKLLPEETPVVAITACGGGMSGAGECILCTSGTMEEGMFGDAGVTAAVLAAIVVPTTSKAFCEDFKD